MNKLLNAIARPAKRLTAPTLVIDGETHPLNGFVKDPFSTPANLTIPRAWLRQLEREDEYELVIHGWEGTRVRTNLDGTFTALGVFDCATVEVTASDPVWAHALLFEVEVEIELRLSILRSQGKLDAPFTEMRCTFQVSPATPPAPAPRTLGRHVR